MGKKKPPPQKKKQQQQKQKDGGGVDSTTVVDEHKMRKLFKGYDYFKVEHLCLQVEGHDVVLDSSLTIKNRRRYGLVGPNGCGKSTLLANIGIENVIPIPKTMTIHRLADGSDESDLTILDAVMRDDHKEERIRLEEQINKLSLEGKEELYKKLDEIGPKARHHACQILADFGFTSYMLHKKTNSLSDGWRMRVALARALYVRADILVLDNPTKHLDFEACAWLEERLAEFDNILIVISNSETLLTKICTDIIEIDVQKKKIVQHCTGYDKYLYGREKQRRGQTVSTKTPQEFAWREPPKTKNPPGLQCVDVEYSKNKVLFKGLNLQIDSNSKIALVGPNGCGKSSLLKILSGHLIPPQGSVSTVVQTQTSSFDHGSIAMLDEDKLAIQYMRECTCNISDSALRTAALGFGLTEQELQRKINSLSDGHKTRLILSARSLRNPHILFLDEPTDHLDFDAVGLLAEGLKNWKGAVVFAGHDIRLINQVAQKIWQIEGQSVTEASVGDIVKYQEKMIQKAAEARYLMRLPSADNFGLFSVGSYETVAMPCLSYEKYIYTAEKCFREPTISLDSFKTKRYMIATAPCNSLEEGFLNIPFEVDDQMQYRVQSEVGKKVASSLLEALWTLDTVCRFCLSDFTSANIYVTPSGEVKFKGVELLKRSDELVERNLFSARIILTDLFSSATEPAPLDIGHLLGLMEHKLEKRPTFHCHASLAPLSNVGEFFMKLFACLHFDVDETVKDKILEDLPHAETFHKDVQSNLLLKAFYDYKRGIQYKMAVPAVESSEYKVERAKKFTFYLRNRISHKLEYIESLGRYLHDMADLAAHVRFSLVNCYLQEKLFDAGATQDLMLHNLVK